MWATFFLRQKKFLKISNCSQFSNRSDVNSQITLIRVTADMHFLLVSSSNIDNMAYRKDIVSQTFDEKGVRNHWWWLWMATEKGPNKDDEVLGLRENSNTYLKKTGWKKHRVLFCSIQLNFSTSKCTRLHRFESRFSTFSWEVCHVPPPPPTRFSGFCSSLSLTRDIICSCMIVH